MECLGNCNTCKNERCVCDEEKREYSKEYRIKNLERLREQERKYYYKNKEKMLENQRKHRESKKEKLK